MVGRSAVGTAILVPVLGRPARVAPLLANIAAVTPEPHRVLFVADANDKAEIAALRKAGAEWITVDPSCNYAAKINAGYHATTEPFVFQAADDLDCHRHWLDVALEYADSAGGFGVVGTVDLCNQRTLIGAHSTHSLIRRAYIEEHSGVIDEPNTVLHEGYPHEFCDDELVGTALARGAYVHAFGSVVEHLHPLVGKADDDATYRRGRAHTRDGRRLFQQRRKLWEPTASLSSRRPMAGSIVYARRPRKISPPTGTRSPTIRVPTSRRPGLR